MKHHHWLILYFSCSCSYNSEFNIKYFRFNLVMWQNLYWLLFIKLLKRWIFVVFHLMDTSNLLIEISYLLSLVVQTNTLDLLISIGFYKNNRTCLGFSFLIDEWTKHESINFDLIRSILKTLVPFIIHLVNFISFSVYTINPFELRN